MSASRQRCRRGFLLFSPAPAGGHASRTVASLTQGASGCGPGFRWLLRGLELFDDAFERFDHFVAFNPRLGEAQLELERLVGLVAEGVRLRSPAWVLRFPCG